MEPMSVTKKIVFGVMALAAVATLALSTQLFETNDAGYIQVKQAAGSGEMSVRATPGVYNQFFGDIHTYKISDVYTFGADMPITVRFNDASTAEISGQIKYRLPGGETQLLQIHQDFRSYEAVQSDLIRQSVSAAIRQTASMFGAEEVYSSRRADFVQLVNEQIKNGIYATSYTETLKKDDDGNRFIERNVMVRTNDEGKPIVSEPSTFKRYGIELVQLIIDDPNFDEKTDELIAKRKEAEQEQVVAKAKAERAKQDAITAQEQGKANVALAEAEALVIKKKAVIEAEKEKEVAEQQALKAIEVKKAIIARGEADARAASLKVAAGLSPLEKAQIDRDTAIGVAMQLAKVQLPKLMVLGGNSNGQAINPFDAVGLESLIKISKNMATEVK
jgi:regulator of protease activity HflC (stomatin/prohibitin superfamily)